MTWLVATLAAFAVYRAARMVTEEDGPMFIFKRLRDAHTNDKHSFDVGLRCFYCVSWWMGGVVTLYLVTSGDISFWQWPLMWGGTAGAACKIYEFWRR